MNTKISDAAVEAAQRALYFAASPEATEADYIRDAQEEQEDAEDVKVWMRAALEAALPHLQGEAVPVAYRVLAFDAVTGKEMPKGAWADGAPPDFVIEFAETNGSAYQVELAYSHPQPAELSEVSEFDQGLYAWMKARGIMPDAHDGMVDMDSVVQALSDYENDLMRASDDALAATGKQQVDEVQGDARVTVRVEGVGQCTLTVTDGGIDIPASTIAAIAARQPVGQEPAFYLTKADADYIAGRNSNANQVVAIREPRSKSAVPFYAAPPAQGIDLELMRDLIDYAESGKVAEPSMVERMRALLDGRDAGTGDA